MGKLSELVKNFVNKIKGLSKRKKIIIGVCLIAVISLIVYASITMKSDKYDILFSNLDNNDSKIVLDKLKEQKIDYNVKGSTIYVPKTQVDQLRLDLASNITGGSKGFELFDSGSKWGMTDKEMDIKYQRALEGELERTIKSLPQVNNAIVHLVMSQKSVFVKEANPASASVTLNLKKDQALSSKQVKAMVALLTGAVENLPKEKVEIMDSNMTLLTENLFSDEKDGLMSSSAMASATEKQQELKKKYEKNLSDNLQDMLEKVYGKGKIKVNINAELNFDAMQQNSVTIDPKSVVVSQKTTKDTSAPTEQKTDTARGVTDNQMQVNKYPASEDVNSGNTTTHSETITNYEVSKVENKTITAPGQVKRLTTSVIVDGNLDEETKTSLKNLITNAVGYNEARGDSVSVEGMRFNTELQEKAQKDLDEMNLRNASLEKNKLYERIGIGIGSLILLLIILVSLKKGRSKKDDMDIYKGENDGLNVVIGDELDPKEANPGFKPIDFEPKENEKTHIEKEIKKYATQKPEQVAEIVKSWLTKDER